MELIFHGGAMEVGRSCIELKLSDTQRYLFDVGVKFKEGGLLLPENLEQVNNINAVFLSHAHLDHSGALPVLEHNQFNAPIYTTRQTIALSKLMLKDSFKVARIRNMRQEYNNADLKQVSKDIRKVSFDTWYKIDDLRFKFFNAGHIPGSAMVLVEVNNKRILYTGDINTQDTELMYKCMPHSELEGKIDVLISESTNGYREFENRASMNKRFLDSIEKTISNGGSVILPVFSIGRAQEILILLSKRDFKVPIYSEGLSNKVTRQILANKSKYVKNKEVLSDMFYNKIHWISSNRKRQAALAKQGIFITTSGMLQGGPVLSYIKELWHDETSKIMVVGYQCKNTNGWHLLNEGFVYIDGWKTYVKCSVERYDFSGHADVKGLKEVIMSINPKTVVFQHGDRHSIEILSNWAKKDTKYKVFTPQTGDKLIF